MRDYYEILQVHPSAEPEVIEAAYRRLVRKYHPDVSTDRAATERTKELNEAYEVLRDPARRADFDRKRTQTASVAYDDHVAEENQATRRNAERRFAEWFVWAKREVSSDNWVGLGAAQAAIEELDAGRDEQTARLAARRSVAGHGIALGDRVAPRMRAYAEWFDWARRKIGGDRESWHRAAEAALDRLEAGGTASDGERAARRATGDAATAAITRAVVQARCQQTVQPIVLHLEHQGPEWIITDCVSAYSSGPRASSIDTPQQMHLAGSLVFASTYNGCPHCNAPTVAQCGGCGGMSCQPADARTHDCPWCNSTSEVEESPVFLDGTPANMYAVLKAEQRREVIRPPSAPPAPQLPPRT